jgi:hypothetical protein
MANPSTAEERLAKLGIHLPDAPTPFGAYVPAVQTGNLLFLSGMFATSGHTPTVVGAAGCPKINLQVRSTNHTVLAFYRAIGFAVDEVVSMGERLQRDGPPDNHTLLVAMTPNADSKPYSADIVSAPTDICLARQRSRFGVSISSNADVMTDAEGVQIDSRPMLPLKPVPA